MIYDTTVPPHNPLTSLSSQSIYASQVERCVVVACLTVSSRLTCSSSPWFILISNIVVLQLCVWDWLIMFADEVAMIDNGKRHSRQYVLDAVYVVVR